MMEESPRQRKQRERLDALTTQWIRPGRLLTAYLDPAAENQSFGNKYGGMPYAEAGETWPHCKNCYGLLTFIIQLFNEEDHELWVFYYCLDCTWKKPTEGVCMKLYHAPSLDKMVPLERAYPGIDRLTPHRVEAKKVKVLPCQYDWIMNLKAEGIDTYELHPSEFIYTRERLGCVHPNRSMWGGHATYLEDDVKVDCPQCGTPLAFFLQLIQEGPTWKSWPGVLYFHRCPVHRDYFHFTMQMPPPR